MSFIESLRQGISSAYCTALGTSENFWSAIADGQNLGTVGPFPIDPAQVIASGLGVATGLFCNVEPVPPPGEPFQGGQCPGTSYSVMVTYTRWSGNQLEERTTTTSGTGPIQGVVLFEEPRGGSSQFVDSGLRITDASGERQFASWSFVESLGFGQQFISSIDISGSPDDCGNPPPLLPPTPPEVRDGIPQPITFVDVDGNNVNLSPVLFFGNAVVNANLDVVIPVRVEFSPEVEINAGVNLTTGDINFNIGGGSGQDETGCPPTPDDSEPIPPEEEELLLRRIVAVRVRATIGGQGFTATVVGAIAGTLNIFGPDLGLVSFLCTTNAAGSNRAWTSDIRVKNVDQIIPCPVPWGAIRVSSSSRPGVSLSLTPIRSDIPVSTFPS